MAKKTVVVRVDDLDHTMLGEHGEPVCFSFDGADYEIDLSRTHRHQFRATLQPYLDAARIIETGERPQQVDAALDRTVRLWAAARSIPLPRRGPVPVDIVAQYQRYHRRMQRRHQTAAASPASGEERAAGVDAVVVELVRRYRAGASVRMLAAEQGRSRSAVRRQLLAAGVPLREQRHLPSDPTWWAERIAGGRSDEQVAAELHVHPYTVARHLKAAGLRQPAERSQPLFPDWLAARTQTDGDCLRWTGGHTSSGYGEGRYHGRKRLAHLTVWEHHHGPVPDGHELTRTPDCPHPDCVNPDHLRPMTPADRIRAKTEAGAFAHGEQHWNAHLTESQARTIKTSSDTVTTLAARYGVSVNTVTSIRAGRRWRHLRTGKAEVPEPSRTLHVASTTDSAFDDSTLP